MGVPEDEGAEFHDADKASEVQNFGVGISTIEHTGEVKKFCTLVDFGPEALFESLFGVLEGCSFFHEVEVGKDADNFWESMRLENIEKFEGFLDTELTKIWHRNKWTHHFESEGTVYHEEH